MKRHPGLVPLSHDHHHGLAAARRLERAADGSPSDRRAAAAAFVRFFADETADHFRTEEELLFPLLASRIEPVRALLARVLTEHVQLRGLARDLRRAAERDDVSGTSLAEPARMLQAHIRIEERELFPAIERLVPTTSWKGSASPNTSGRRCATAGPWSIFAPAWRTGRSGARRARTSTPRSFAGRPAGGSRSM